MPQLRWIALLAFAFACLMPQLVTAAPITLGVLTFNTFIDGPDGTNGIFLSNFTGDPDLGGFALPPDFPVSTFLTFDSPSLSWSGDVAGSFDFGGAEISPGTLDPDPLLQFSAATLFSSLTFSGLLSTDTFELTDGSFFTAISPLITATILASPGGSLLPGDFALLTIEANPVKSPAPVPEPSSFVLLGSALAGFAALRRRTTRRSV